MVHPAKKTTHSRNTPNQTPRVTTPSHLQRLQHCFLPAHESVRHKYLAVRDLGWWGAGGALLALRGCLCLDDELAHCGDQHCVCVFFGGGGETRRGGAE
jgi:hypothetical protein